MSDLDYGANEEASALYAQFSPQCDRYWEISEGTYSGMHALKKAEIERRYDEFVTMRHAPNCPDRTFWRLGPDDYRDELNRRALNRQSLVTLALALAAIVVSVVGVLVEVQGPPW